MKLVSYNKTVNQVPTNHKEKKMFKTIRTLALVTVSASLLSLANCAGMYVSDGNTSLDNKTAVAKATTVGETKNQVIALLGDPDSTEDGGNVLVYRRRTLTGIGGMLAGAHKTKVLKIKLRHDKVVSSSEDILKAGNLVQRAQ